jgi:hypothetical protein
VVFGVVRHSGSETLAQGVSGGAWVWDTGSLIFVPLCGSCMGRLVARNRLERWEEDDGPMKIV